MLEEEVLDELAEVDDEEEVTVTPIVVRGIGEPSKWIVPEPVVQLQLLSELSIQQ